jgi:hypothetical protein
MKPVIGRSERGGEGDKKGSVAKFIVPDWRDKVDSGLCSLAGRCDNLYAEVNFIPPVRDYEFGHRMK